MSTASWIIRRKVDNAVLFETFNRNVVDHLNIATYEAVPILDYLYGINRAIRAQEHEHAQ